MIYDWNQIWQKRENSLLSMGPSACSRRRIVDRLIRKFSRDGGSLLDVGCGTGELLLFADEMKKFKKLCGIDVSQTAIDAARNNHPVGRFDVLDIEKEKLPERFDVIVCMATLELKSIEDDQAAINNMSQMLMPGGHLILAVQHRKEYWNKLDDQYNLRRYEALELVEKCEKAGLKNVEMFSWGWPLYNIYYRLMAKAEYVNNLKDNGFGVKLASCLLFYLFFFDDLFIASGRGRWLFGVFVR